MLRQQIILDFYDVQIKLGPDVGLNVDEQSCVLECGNRLY